MRCTFFRLCFFCIADDASQGSRPNKKIKTVVDEDSHPLPSIVLASIGNLPPRSGKDVQHKRKQLSAEDEASHSFIAPLPVSKSPKQDVSSRRGSKHFQPYQGKVKSILDRCLDFVSSDSLAEIAEFKEHLQKYIASQDEETGKYVQVVLDGKMAHLFKTYATLQTFVLESLNTSYSLGIKALTTHGIVKNSEVWAALGPELSEKISGALDTLVQVIDDTFFSIGNFLVDPVSVFFYLAVHITDAYKSRHSDKKPFLMLPCKGVAQVLLLFYISRLSPHVMFGIRIYPGSFT